MQAYGLPSRSPYYGVLRVGYGISSANGSHLFSGTECSRFICQLLPHVSVTGSEYFPEIEIETVMTVLGNAVGDIERTDKSVKPDKQAAGSDQIVEFNIIGVLPGVARLQGSAQVRGH